MGYQWSTETFGEYGEAEAVADSRGNAATSVGKFVGNLARAFMTHRAAKRAQQMPIEALQARGVPCPDATPDTPPDETPCARRARELRERAAAARAERLARRGR